MAPPGKIRKDDLDALGDMAGLVGSYMNNFQQGTTDGRRNLFKTNTNPKETIMRALQTDDQDLGQVVVPDTITPEQANTLPIPITEEVSIPTPSTPIYRPTPQSGYIAPPQRLEQLIRNEVNSDTQMEFSFMKQAIGGYGCVQDVIKHFDDRLDNIEENIKILTAKIKKLEDEPDLVLTSEGVEPA